MWNVFNEHLILIARWNVCARGVRCVPSLTAIERYETFNSKPILVFLWKVFQANTTVLIETRVNETHCLPMNYKSFWTLIKVLSVTLRHSNNIIKRIAASFLSSSTINFLFFHSQKPLVRFPLELRDESNDKRMLNEKHSRKISNESEKTVEHVRFDFRLFSISRMKRWKMKDEWNTRYLRGSSVAKPNKKKKPEKMETFYIVEWLCQQDRVNENTTRIVTRKPVQAYRLTTKNDDPWPSFWNIQLVCCAPLLHIISVGMCVCVCVRQWLARGRRHFSSL